MGCWWYIEGTVKPQTGKMDDAVGVLKEYDYDCDFGSGIEEGTLDVSFSGERGDSFADDFVAELAPFLQEGEIDVHNDDDDTYYRYECRSGKYTFRAGDKFIYFPGYEEDFAEQLPDEVIQAVLRKHADIQPDRLSVKTPGGVIEAKISPESNYAGIWVQNVSMPGEPGAVMEYGPVEDDGTPSIKLRVYKAEDPHGNPDVYRMGKEQ